jgi:hypothetical protein
MKNISIIALLITLQFISFSCDEKNLQSNNLTVTGVVISNNHPIEGANISIDSIHNWSAISSADGSFQINNVPSGKHSMYISEGDKSNSFTQKEYEIYVDESNTDLEYLLLPNPVILNEPSNVGFTSLELAWNKTDASDFYEYKLYRHNSPGLDENTGELIYVSTNSEDTTFTDGDLISSTDYYYRVFVMNQFGRLGGSNIVNSKTLTGNLIPSGSFEDLTNFENNWSLNNTQGTLTTTIIDSLYKVGFGCLYNKNDSAYVNGNSNTYTDIMLKTPINIGIDKNYEISCWFKAYGQQGTNGSVWVVVKQGNDYITRLDLGIEANGFGGDWGVNDTGWVFKTKSFYVTKDEPISIYIVMPIEHVWIDELKILPAE